MLSTTVSLSCNYMPPALLCLAEILQNCSFISARAWTPIMAPFTDTVPACQITHSPFGDQPAKTHPSTLLQSLPTPRDIALTAAAGRLFYTELQLCPSYLSILVNRHRQLLFIFCTVQTEISAQVNSAFEELVIQHYYR